MVQSDAAGKIGFFLERYYSPRRNYAHSVLGIFLPCKLQLGRCKKIKSISSYCIYSDL